MTPPRATPSGSIEGAVSYPADVLLAQSVYAVATDGSRSYHVETAGFGRRAVIDRPWGEYKLLGVSPGNYYVLAAVRDLTDQQQASARAAGTWRFGAAYTRSVRCGLSVKCTDHRLVVVHVSAGRVAKGINPTDWYAAPNAYPLVPAGGEPAMTLAEPPATFGDAKQAAVYFAQLHTSARYVESSSACRVNLACLWLTAERAGHAATYFTGRAGTNGLFRTCTVYLNRTASGWQYADSNCRRPTTAFPAVVSKGSLVIGFGAPACINIRSSPSPTARVVACVPEQTAVTIDDGPYYVVGKTSTADLATDYWWHIANRGWVAHSYVMYSP